MDQSPRVDYLPETGIEASQDRGVVRDWFVFMAVCACVCVCGGGGQWDVNKQPGHARPGCVSGDWISGLDKESAANPDTIKAPLQTQPHPVPKPTSHNTRHPKQ